MGNIRKTVHPMTLTGLIIFAAIGSIIYANNRGEMFFEQAERLNSESDYASAAHSYKKAIRNLPFKGKYYYGLAQALEASGDEKGAAREYKKAHWLGYEGPK